MCFLKIECISLFSIIFSVVNAKKHCRKSVFYAEEELFKARNTSLFYDSV